MKHLVFLDTDRVKDYVFGSYKLREVRGASALLDYLNRWQSRVKWQEIAHGSVLYSHGGTTMGSFSSQDEAEQAVQVLENLYHEESGSAASITGSWVEWDGHDSSFLKARRELALKVRLAKEQHGRMPAAPFSLPLLHFCQSCGGVPVREIDSADGRALCAGCVVKREWSEIVQNTEKRVGLGWQDAFLDKFRRWLDTHPEFGWGKENLDRLMPKDLNAIGEVSTPQGYVGFIYCDANGLGQVLQSKGSNPLTLGRHAEDVDTELREVTYKAIARRLKLRRNGLPFEIVLLGGDDLVLITAADQALDVAREIVQGFIPRIEDTTITLSAGVVLAHASFPIASFFRLAEELLRLAKRERASREWKKGAIDFAVVSSAGAQAVENARQEEWTASLSERRNLVLTERPYPIDPGDCKNSRPSFPEVLHAVRQLKKNGMPRSRLYYLYESLFDALSQTEVVATIAAKEVFSRLSRESIREAFGSILKRFCSYAPPWRDAGGRELRTLFLDLIELWDFIPEREEP